jgi:hypothetical protein
MGVQYRSYTATTAAAEASRQRLPENRGDTYYPDVAGHAEGRTDDPPPSNLSNPGMWNRRVEPGPAQGQGQDKAGVDGKTWPVPDPKQWGAHAIYKFGSFVYNQFTNRRQVQAELIATVGPQGGDSRPGFDTQRSALELPRWRFTAVTDQQVLDNARARAKAKAGR